jgi:hypothetical protein
VADELSSVDIIKAALMEAIREEKRAYKREYMRQWRARNRDRVKANNERYILKKAEILKAEQTHNTQKERG